jgi:opacity protein-like surface antigen
MNNFRSAICLAVFGLASVITTSRAEDIQYRVGIGCAVEYLNLEAKEKDDFTGLGSVNLIDRKQTQKKIQCAPSVEFGLTCLEDYYLGVIASWRYSNAHTDSRSPLYTNNYFIQKFKLNSYANILAKLGYKLAPKTMVYGLLGPSIAKWSHQTNQYLITRGVSNQVNTFSLRKTTVGVAFGFGLEQCLNENFALSVDYVHGFLKDKSAGKRLSVLTPSFDPDIGVIMIPRTGVAKKKVRPSYDSIALRFSYFF